MGDGNIEFTGTTPPTAGVNFDPNGTTPLMAGGKPKSACPALSTSGEEGVGGSQEGGEGTNYQVTIPRRSEGEVLEHQIKQAQQSFRLMGLGSSGSRIGTNPCYLREISGGDKRCTPSLSRVSVCIDCALWTESR